MKVSVIIPVYNAEAYVRQAVQSALDQPETAEVILIDDCSPDNSWDVCLRMASEDSRIRLLQHSDGRNHGAGESRNIGIQRATCDYIAFLDADDYYLPGRFKITKTVFEKFTDADGVYEAIGVHFEDEEARRKYYSFFNSDLTTMTETIAPDQLFEALVIGGKGHFSGDGLVVKSHIFQKTGLFSTELVQSQDMDMWTKMAAKGKLYPGDIGRPVAMRRVHSGNRFLNDRRRAHFYIAQRFKVLWKWSGKEKLSRERQLLILFRLLKANGAVFHDRHWAIRAWVKYFTGVSRLLQRPSLFSQPYLYQNTICRWFGRFRKESVKT